MFPPVWVYFLALVVLLELLADVLAKHFAMSGKFIFAALALLGFIATNVAWLTTLRTGGQLGRGAILFSVFTGIGAVLIGRFMYKEKVPRYQLIGLLLGIAAIAFLSIGQ